MTVLIGRYAPRITVHPDRFGGVKSKGSNLWLVLHTSEGPEGVESAEQLAGFLTRPGDRTSSSGNTYGASYHAIFDTDQIIPAVPDNVVAWSAGGGNARGVHGCFPGRAGQTREQWLDPISRAMIRQAAAWTIDRARMHNIPLLQITPEQMKTYMAGVADHYTVTQAFKKSTHTDVGPHFPWDVFWSDVTLLSQPPAPPNPDPEPEPEPEEDDEDMDGFAALYEPTDELLALGMNKSFVLTRNGDVRHASGPCAGTAIAQGAHREPILGKEHYDQCVELDKVWRTR